MKKAIYNKFEVCLVESVSEMLSLKQYINPNVLIGVDTETDGLNPETCSIAGVCISLGKSYSFTDYKGYYLPVRHEGYPHNLPIKDVIEFLQSLVDTYGTAWWNRNFDINMLENDGFVLNLHNKTLDVQCLAHLIQSESMPALKTYTERYLNFKTIHFSDNNAEDNNFKKTDPSVSFVYAAADPLITALLYRRIWSQFPYTHKIFPLDNNFAEALRRLQPKVHLYIYQENVEKQLRENAKELEAVRAKIFSLVGYQFNLSSNVDKIDALSRVVVLTKKTKSGKFKVDKEVLATIDHPLAKLLLEYSHLYKVRTSYLEKFSKFPQPFSVNYQHCNAPTGRLTSGTSKGSPKCYAPINIQNIPKKVYARYLHRDKNSSIGYVLDDEPAQPVNGQVETPQGVKDLSQIVPGDEIKTSHGFKRVLFIKAVETSLLHFPHLNLSIYPESYIQYDGSWVLASTLEGSSLINSTGYLLSLEDNDVYSLLLSGVNIQFKTLLSQNTKAGLRDLFHAADGYLWICCDYSSEEVCILANMAREPSLLTPLSQGADIHKYVATQMFGHYDPAHRTISKTITFCANYGGGASTIAARLKIPKEQAQQYLDKYNKTLSKVTAWKEYQAKQGRRKGLVSSYFGRPRVVSQYYTSSDTSLYAFADRTCINSPIQATGADVMRIIMIRLNNMYDKESNNYDPSFAENTYFLISQHDELMLGVKPSYLQEAVTKLQRLMEVKLPNWQAQLRTSASVGVDWGHQIEIEGFNSDGSLVLGEKEDISMLN